MIFPGRFDNHYALVSGGATGIGLCVSERMLAEGGKVAALGVDPEQLYYLESHWGKEKVYARAVDISVKEQVLKFVEDASATLGSIDILINNAGFSDVNSIAETTEESLDKHYAINVKGPCFLMSALLPTMKNNGKASIVNVGSILGIVARPGTTAYSASKAAIIQLTKTWAIELCRNNIRVNAVCPAYIETPRIKNIINSFNNSEELRYDLSQLHPMRRLGQPYEVANAILFLASDESSFITGSILTVDGGYTAW